MPLYGPFRGIYCLILTIYVRCELSKLDEKIPASKRRDQYEKGSSEGRDRDRVGLHGRNEQWHTEFDTRMDQIFMRSIVCRSKTVNQKQAL